MNRPRSANGPLILVLFYWFFAFPLFVRNLDPGLYSAVRYGLILVALGYSFSRGSTFSGWRDIRHGLATKSWLVGFISLYGVYMIFLLLATVIAASNTAEPISFMRALANKLQILLFSLWIFLALNTAELARVLKLYVNFILVLSVLGVATVIIVYFKLLEPISIVTLDNGAERQFYGTGFVWGASWSGSLLGITRLQSYSDEAGTFAFALAPAILLSLREKRYIAAAFLLICLVGTFSIGGIAAIFIGLLCLSIRRSEHRRSALAVALIGPLLVLTLLLILSISQNFSLSDANGFFSHYLSSKYDDALQGSDTSLGARIQNVRETFQLIDKHPWGVGLVVTEAFEGSLAVGWLVPLVQAGIAGWLFYVCAFGLLLWQGLYAAIFTKGSAAILGAVVVILGFSALQRGEMDSTAWHFWWIVVFIRLRLATPIEQESQGVIYMAAPRMRHVRY